MSARLQHSTLFRPHLWDYIGCGVVVDDLVRLQDGIHNILGKKFGQVVKIMHLENCILVGYFTLHQFPSA